MTADLEVREDFKLRRTLGGGFMFLSLPLLFLAYLAHTNGNLLATTIILATGLFCLGLGGVALFVRGKPLIRLRITDQGIWLLPSSSNWFLFATPSNTPVTIPWNDLTGIDDGGVMYGYRRLQFTTQHGTHRLDTTHLDTQLRTIIPVIAAKLEKNGKTLVEADLGMQARTGRWHIR